MRRCFHVLPATLLITVLLVVAGCDESGPTSGIEGDSPTARQSRADLKGGPLVDLVTQSPKRLAEALRAIGNENEVMVALKAEGAPRVALEHMKENASVVAGVPVTSGNAARRSELGFARSGPAAYKGVMQALKAKGVEPYRADPEAPIISVRIPDAKLTPVLAALMKHPNVDYIEANQKRRLVFRGGRRTLPPAALSTKSRIYAEAVGAPFAFSTATTPPEGANPADDKHTFHNVLQAWDYTRGSGAKVGILDSGFAYDQGTGQYHGDGDLLTSTKGIKKKGFNDDYNYTGCDASGQPYGNCIGWDDVDHGTLMAGLVGANDNSQGYVGIMPEGLTVSIKMIQDCSVADDGCGNAFGYYAAVEDDDFYWAVNWASQDSDIEVLSMSFGAEYGSSVRNALYDAYYTYDILLLGAERNNPSNSTTTPASELFVMGVGGLKLDSSNHGADEYETVSALAGGGTTEAYCPSNSFCEPDGSVFLNPPNGGTSSATAITAGIAGLVRAHNPSLSAYQVRERLRRTAVGSHNKVNALAAVTDNGPFSISVDGPQDVAVGSGGTWTASSSGADDSQVTYTWYWDGIHYKQETVSVGTGSSMSRGVFEAGIHVVRVEATSGGESDFDELNVYTD